MSSATRSLLITGGAGFIGGNFVRHWADRFPHDDVIVLDALTYAGNLSTISALIDASRITFVQGNITDGALVRDVLTKHAVNTIVHFAAESHVDRSIANPGEFVQTNVVGTQQLLDCARAAWFQDGAWLPGVRFHHVSTDEVFGSLLPDEPAFTENTPYSPRSPYAASKAASDHLVRAFAHTFGLPTTISNCSNNYGPFHFPEKLIPLVILNALRGKPLPIYGDGQQVRDWLFVTDHCRAIEQIILRGAVERTYNVGGRAEHPNVEIVRMICGIIDAKFREDAHLASVYPDCPAASGNACSSLVTYVKDRPGHDRRYAIDPTRIATELGFEPSHDLETGLRETVQWYLDNADWWSGILDGSYRQWIEHQYGAGVN